MGVVYAKEPFRGQLVEKGLKPLKEVPARVDKVHFDGIRRTKCDILQKVLGDLFEAENVREVAVKASGVRQQLKCLNVFQSIDITLDASQGPNASPEGLEVIFDVVELKPQFDFAYVEHNGSILVKCGLPNVLGRGEAMHVEYGRGNKALDFSMLPTNPLLGWAKSRVNMSLFGHTTDFPFSEFREKVKGLAAEVLFESLPQVQHTLRWEGAWRNVGCLSPGTPFLIREEAGDSVKSSLKHILTMDQRDNPCLPSSGSYFKICQEYAGPGGNVNFLKHEVQYQVNKRIWGDLVLQGTLKGGLVRPLGSDAALRINDRFFLGGPLSLRGFGVYGVGPRTQNCHVGAEAYWTGGLHVYAPLPNFGPLKHFLDKICRAHIFVNTGNIGNFAFTDDYHHNANALLSRLRWSCGAGLVFAIGGMARFELNYCFPISSESGDELNTGFQFGISLL